MKKSKLTAEVFDDAKISDKEFGDFLADVLLQLKEEQK